MNVKMKALITLILVVVIIAGLWFVSKAITAYTGYSITGNVVTEEFAECLGQEGVVLYVSTGCPHCIVQEEMFGENLKTLNVINCALEADKCIEAGVTAVPTWSINGEKILGVQSLAKLAGLTGCELK